MEGLITLLFMVILIFMSIPIAFAMITVSILVYIFVAHIPVGVVVQNLFYNMQSYSYSAIPYFILAGNVMARGTLAKRLVDIAEAYIGFIPCGMAISAVIGCALFGSVSGSDIATLAAIGGIVFPVLIKRGWPRNFIVGIIGPSALLGLLIPPTVPGIIYALVTEVSVMKVFLSGILPGIIIVTLFSSYIYLKGRRLVPNQRFQKPDVTKMVKTLKNGWTALGMPVIIFGGIYGGVFTVTESAAVAAAYALFVELVIHRGLKFREIPTLVIEAGTTTALILFLVSGAMVLARFLTLEQIPQMWAEQVLGVVKDKWVFMLLVNVLLLVTGCLIDIASATVILAPILKVFYFKYGINEIHFASMFLLNLYIGYLTPPVGLNIYVCSSMFGIKFVECCKAYIPYFVMLIIVLVLVTLLPWLSTWLPSIFVG
jgi:C4-dicarboxylate transporter, DctM subunit